MKTKTIFILFLLFFLPPLSAQTVTTRRAANGINPYPQLFFGTAAPGSVTGNLPGDEFSDTTGHNFYKCNATSGTAAPACTSVTAGGWTLLNSAGGSSVVQQAIVSVSAAEIKNLVGSPKTIVAAQGAGTYIELLSSTVEFVCSGCTAFASGGNTAFGFSATGFTSTSISAGNFDALTTTSIIQFAPGGAGAALVVGAGAINQPLVLLNGAPDYTTGTGTLNVHVQYVVHTGF